MEAQLLYKYRSLRTEKDREHTRQVIVDGKIWYASPGHLNDPFDCLAAISMEDAPLPGASEETIRELKDRVENEFRRRNEKELAVLSLSAKNNNALMWAHYADSHQGICLELRVPLHNELHRVTYSDERPTTSDLLT